MEINMLICFVMFMQCLYLCNVYDYAIICLTNVILL